MSAARFGQSPLLADSAAPKFPEIGFEPFNPTPEELARTWEAGKE